MTDWILLSFLAAIFLAGFNILIKKVSDTFNEYSTALLTNLFTAPFLWVFVLLSGVPAVDYRFWPLILAVMPIEIAGAIFFFRAFKVGKISEIIPITAIYPLTVALGSVFFLNEQLKSISFFSIVLLSIGAYLMNLEKNMSFFDPIKKLWSNKGSQLIIAVAIVISITIPLGKVLSEYSSSQFYSAVYYSLLIVCFFPLAFLKGDISSKKISFSYKSLLLLAVFNAGFIFAFWKASQIGNVSIVNAIRMLNILFSLGFSAALLKEKITVKQLVGSSLMISGAILILI